MRATRPWAPALATLIGVLLLASSSTHADAATGEQGEQPTVFARAWVVADAATGDVLAAKRPHEQLRPASTLKILSAITLLPRLDLADSYRAQWQDAHVTGSAVGIVPGSRYTVDELFYGLMLPSGNDAARALASANGGYAKTVRQMNETADDLGAADTRAVNPTGLDAPGQHSSAFDLAVFAREGLTDADFRRYVSTVSVPFPAQEPKRDKRRDTFMIYNQNPLLLDGYRGVLGVKTGYTTEAGRTFVAAARRDGQTLIVSLMGVVEPSETAAAKLLDWGFRHPDTEPIGSLEPRPDAPTTPPVPSAAPQTQVASVLPGSDTSAPWSLVVGGAVALVLLSSGWWYLRRRP
jgi:D-alanyl-D-alanine carboxypeptidase (penicillin-binding protein 5/6)